MKLQDMYDANLMSPPEENNEQYTRMPNTPISANGIEKLLFNLNKTRQVDLIT